MSLVENLINQISTNGLGGITRPQNFDLEDDTFAKLLEKQMNNANTPNTIGAFNEMGAPAGLVIEPYENVEFSNTAQDQMEIIGFKNPQETQMVEPVEIKELDMSDYFSNLLKESAEHKDFFNFAKKQASNAYNLFGKSYITDAIDFADDLATRM